MGMELTPEDEQALREPDPHIGELADALGLDKEFTKDVTARGQLAILDRAQSLDKNGALGRVMSICQRLGCYLQERAEQGEPRAQQFELLEAIAQLADAHDIDRFIAARLVGTVIEVHDRAAQQIMRGTGNGKLGA